MKPVLAQSVRLRTGALTSLVPHHFHPSIGVNDVCLITVWYGRRDAEAGADVKTPAVRGSPRLPLCKSLVHGRAPGHLTGVCHAS